MDKFEIGKEYFFDEEKFVAWCKSENLVLKESDGWIRRMGFKDRIIPTSENHCSHTGFTIFPEWCVEKSSK